MNGDGLPSLFFFRKCGPSLRQKTRERGSLARPAGFWRAKRMLARELRERHLRTRERAEEAQGHEPRENGRTFNGEDDRQEEASRYAESACAWL